MLEESAPKPSLRSTGQSAEITKTSTDVPQVSAEFRTMPQDAEEFGKVPQPAERRENHTLTVREAARMFEAAGVARTERSIINWCQPNRQGITRLDSYYDPNERKYFITPQSVEMAIQEEIQRAKKSAEIPGSESFGNSAEPVKHLSTGTAKIAEERKFQELEREIVDLKITNRVKDGIIGMKDKFIEQLQHDQRNYIERLIESSHRIGELETKLLQIESPARAQS